MFERILSWHARDYGGGDEDGSGHRGEGKIAVSQLRALAAEAGLVAAVDGSLGGLVNLWAAHDTRLHPHFDHRPPSRRAN